MLISLPKLKTHHWAGATLSLKNLFGTLPGICYGWPKNELHWRGIDNSIVDIALTRTPDLAIVDGIIGMEGDGPLNGTAQAAGRPGHGLDLVAVDATCCRLMQLDPERIGYLVLGYRKKLGLLRETEIQQLGEHDRRPGPGRSRRCRTSSSCIRDVGVTTCHATLARKYRHNHDCTDNTDTRAKSLRAKRVAPGPRRFICVSV